MKNKTLFAGGISMLALGLFAMPSLAADKTKTMVKTSKGDVECEITVTDGNVVVKKTVNGKAVKAGKDDKDCNMKHGNMAFDGDGDGKMFKVVVDSAGGENIHVERLVGDSSHVFFSEDGEGKGKHRVFVDKIEGMGGNRVFLKNMKEFDGEGMHWMGKGGSGPGLHRRGGNGFRFMMADSFGNEELDLNKDGDVTEEEARQARSAKLKSFDRNNDGRLSLDEYEGVWMEARRKHMVDAFQDLDEDGDAQVTIDEFSASATRGARMHKKMKTMMEKHEDTAVKTKVKKKKK